MDFSNYLEEAFNERMKKTIDKKILTKVGRILARYGIGVENSEFKHIPGYRFRLGAALPSKTGDQTADSGYVIVITKDNDVKVVQVENGRTASIVYQKGEKTLDPIRSLSDFIKTVKDAYIVETQQQVQGKRTKRRMAQEVHDHLDDVHYKVVKRMEALQIVNSDYIRGINAKLSRYGAKIQNIGAKKIGDYIGVHIKLTYSYKPLEGAIGAFPEVKKINGVPRICLLPYGRIDLRFDPRTIEEMESKFEEIAEEAEDKVEVFERACGVCKIIYTIDVSKILVKDTD